MISGTNHDVQGYKPYSKMSSDQTALKVRLIPSTRFLVALLVSFALFIQYAQRVSLSMGIVCMIDRTALKSQTNSTSQSIPVNSTTGAKLVKYGSQFVSDRQFVWTELQQQIVLGAQWFGYLLMMAPGGWIAVRLGAKKTFALSLLVSSSATVAMIFIYFVNDFHYILAGIFRVITGLGHGPLFPATYAVWSMWAVPLERSTLTAIGFCSTNLGTSMTMLAGGVFCRYFTSGWMNIFLLTGLLGFIWLPLWLWHMSDSPLSHRRINETERKYICDHIGIATDGKKNQVNTSSAVPWKKAFRSKALMALCVTQSCNLFGLFFFYTNVGKILTEIHRIPVQNAGYILAIGFILMPISSLSAGIVADRLLRAKKISLTNIRKVFNSVASFGAGLCMIALCFCDESRQVFGVITVLLFLITSATAYGSGYVVNFGDIVPAYSSVIFGAAGTAATFTALLSNIIAGILIKRPILEDWRKLFILFAICHFIGGVVYVLYGSGVPRKWATMKSQKSPNNAVQQDPEATQMLKEENTFSETKPTDTNVS